jgi:protein-L-isoaspartate(D-aspartate) O-methyltransferase
VTEEPDDPHFAFARQAMVREQVLERGVTDAAVLRAMERVPRHCFVPADRVEQAYDDGPLPIACGQTISQPYIVGEMLGLALDGRGHVDRALDVGTGCGYQAALLALLAREVDSVEVVPELAASARARLDALGYANVRVLEGDARAVLGGQGPYDVIVSGCAPESLPEVLVELLAPGGRLVIPVGPAGSQVLVRVARRPDGSLAREQHAPVLFLPMVSRPQHPRTG